MSITPVPVLGTQSFVSDSANKFNQLITDIFVADYNQSLIYASNVTSISRMLQLSGNDANKIVTIFTSQLRTYFSRYYDNVNVSVSVDDDTDSDKPDALIIKLVVSIQESDQESTYGYLLKTASGNLDKLIKIVNFGE